MSKWKCSPQTIAVQRPDTQESAVAQVTDKYSEYPSNSLSPVRLTEIFKEADAGDILRQAEFVEGQMNGIEGLEEII